MPGLNNCQGEPAKVKHMGHSGYIFDFLFQNRTEFIGSPGGEVNAGYQIKPGPRMRKLWPARVCNGQRPIDQRGDSRESAMIRIMFKNLVDDSPACDSRSANDQSMGAWIYFKLSHAETDLGCRGRGMLCRWLYTSLIGCAMLD